MSICETMNLFKTYFMNFIEDMTILARASWVNFIIAIFRSAMKTSMLWCLVVAMVAVRAEATASTTSCSTNEVRLLYVDQGVNSSTSYNGTIYYLAGVLEICVSGTYQAICNSTFTASDTMTYCRSIGYPSKLIK